VDDDDDEDDDEYARKMLNQLHVKSIACFFFYLSAFSSIHLRKRWEDRWMDAVSRHTLGPLIIAGFFEICRMCN
jgi:hypothetical protein